MGCHMKFTVTLLQIGTNEDCFCKSRFQKVQHLLKDLIWIWIGIGIGWMDGLDGLDLELDGWIWMDGWDLDLDLDGLDGLDLDLDLDKYLASHCTLHSLLLE